MSSTLAMFTPGGSGLPKAVSEPFDGIPIHVVRLHDDRKFIRLASIEQAFPRSGKAIGQMSTRAEFLTVDIDGIPTHEEFIPRDAFIGAILGDERFHSFRRFVVELLEQLEDRGVVVTPDVANDPRIQAAQALVTATVTAIRAERLAEETARRTAQLERSHQALEAKVAGNQQVALDTLSVVRHGKEFVHAIPWLTANGVRVPKPHRSSVGNEIASISRQHFKYDPDSRAKEWLGSFACHVYPLAVMEKVGRRWMDLNRSRADRCGWLKN